MLRPWEHSACLLPFQDSASVKTVLKLSAQGLRQRQRLGDVDAHTTGSCCKFSPRVTWEPGLILSTQQVRTQRKTERAWPTPPKPESSSIRPQGNQDKQCHKKWQPLPSPLQLGPVWRAEAFPFDFGSVHGMSPEANLHRIGPL